MDSTIFSCRGDSFSYIEHAGDMTDTGGTKLSRRNLIYPRFIFNSSEGWKRSFYIIYSLKYPICDLFYFVTMYRVIVLLCTSLSIASSLSLLLFLF